jgi:hypothetical protein
MKVNEFPAFKLFNLSTYPDFSDNRDFDLLAPRFFYHLPLG